MCFWKWGRFKTSASAPWAFKAPIFYGRVEINVTLHLTLVVDSPIGVKQTI